MSVLPRAGPVFSIVRSSVVENISLCEVWVERSVIQWWNFTSVGIQVFYFTTFMLFFIISRDGVEDTRLEAKAKDTKKKSEAKAKDSLSEDRHSRGQGQECSRPRTQAQVLSKKKRFSQKFFRRSPKKKVFRKIFQAISTKKRFPKNFSSAPQNFNNSKNTAVLEPRTGQFSRN